MVDSGNYLLVVGVGITHHPSPSVYGTTYDMDIIILSAMKEKREEMNGCQGFPAKSISTATCHDVCAIAKSRVKTCNEMPACQKPFISSGSRSSVPVEE